MKDLEKSEKVDILIFALEERYKSQHVIRERVQSIGVWALGLFLASGGWLIQSEISLSNLEKFVYILGLACAVFVLRFKYLDDLQTGFKSQQQVAVRLEKTLGLFGTNVFDDELDSIYPQAWQNAGKIHGHGRFFATTYLLLYVGAIFLTVSILLNDNIEHRAPRLSNFESPLCVRTSMSNILL